MGFRNGGIKFFIPHTKGDLAGVQVLINPLIMISIEAP